MEISTADFGNVQFVTGGPHTWHARVKEKANDKEWDYWLNGNFVTRELVARHISDHFHAVKLLHCERADCPPEKIRMSVPPHHYQFGILDRLERGSTNPNLIDRTPISRKPIVIR